MKKILLALLLICILGMLSGCQPSNTENSEKNSETEQSETEISTETEIISETEIENTEHHETEISSETETENTEVPAPIRYEFADYEPANKIGRTLEMVVFDTKIYSILHKSGESDLIESDTNPYYLVSFDKNGSKIFFLDPTPRIIQIKAKINRT